MGQNLERLDRLQANRRNLLGNVLRVAQTVQTGAVQKTVDSASIGLRKAAQLEAFEGNLGTAITKKLASIESDLERFAEYQSRLAKSVELANEALQGASDKASGLPSGELSPGQQSTIDMAAKTGSPVQVSPGTTMTPEQATQYYQAQAEAEREEAARKLTAALDARLQEIIAGLPQSEYDPEGPDEEDDRNRGGTGPNSVDPGGVGGPGSYQGPGVDGGGSGIQDPGVVGGGPGGGSGIGGPGIGGPGNGGPGGGGNGGTGGGLPTVPSLPDREDPGPHIDGDIGGLVPGMPPGGTLPPGGGPTTPGGMTAPGGGLTAPGGGTTGVGGLAVGAGAGGIAGGGRVGGIGRVGGLSGVGGAGGIGGAAGAAGAVGGSAQGASGAGARGGVMAGGMAGAGGAAGSGKKSRRRGQDLLAFEVDPDDDDRLPDIGAAGAAGSAASDGREELGW